MNDTDLLSHVDQLSIVCFGQLDDEILKLHSYLGNDVSLVQCHSYTDFMGDNDFLRRKEHVLLFAFGKDCSQEIFQEFITSNFYSCEAEHIPLYKSCFLIQTRRQARNLSRLLLPAGKTGINTSLALTELMVNSVEHGCLEIGSELKGQLLADGDLSQEIQIRRAKPVYRNRWVEVKWLWQGCKITIDIKDPGPGFKPCSAMSADDPDTTCKHGRGIMIAQNYFDELIWRDRGSRVVAKIIL